VKDNLAELPGRCVKPPIPFNFPPLFGESYISEQSQPRQQNIGSNHNRDTYM